MKIIVIILLAFGFFSNAQTLPNQSLTDLNGKKINLSEFKESDKPLVMAFWATWCIPCREELNNINEKIIDWKDEMDFDFYAVSIDDPRSAKKVKLLVNAKAWDFDVLLDSNQDVKRDLNVNNIPNTFIFYKGELVYTHVGYALGEEDDLFAKVKEVVSNE